MAGQRGTCFGLAIFVAALFLAGGLLPGSVAEAGAKRQLVPFAVTPFPYHGEIPDKGKPFMDVNQNGRLGHTSGRAGVLWEDQTYSDKRVLLYVPSSFNPHKPAVMILFFHGNQALLERDVDKRQGVLRQLAASKLNAVLVAPQFAVDALDSSAGSFWQPGTLLKFLDEAAGRLAVLDKRVPRETFARMPVVIVAYSGGYLPAAYSLAGGGANERIVGVVLMDALYGEVDKVAAWIGRKAQAVFVLSAYSKSSADTNAQLMASLSQAGVANRRGVLGDLAPGRVVFLSAGDEVEHKDFLTRAWTADPLRAVFARIAAFGAKKAVAAVPPAKPKTATTVTPPAKPKAVATATPPAKRKAAVAATPPPQPEPQPAPAAADVPTQTTALLPEVPMQTSLPPRNLGAIVPSQNSAGVAGGSLFARPASTSIELARAATQDEAAKLQLRPECVAILSGRAPVVVAAAGAFSLRIGPFKTPELNILCNKLRGQRCSCNPVPATP